MVMLVFTKACFIIQVIFAMVIGVHGTVVEPTTMETNLFADLIQGSVSKDEGPIVPLLSGASVNNNNRSGVAFADESPSSCGACLPIKEQDDAVLAMILVRHNGLTSEEYIPLVEEQIVQDVIADEGFIRYTAVTTEVSYISLFIRIYDTLENVSNSTDDFIIGVSAPLVAFVGFLTHAEGRLNRSGEFSDCVDGSCNNVGDYVAHRLYQGDDNEVPFNSSVVERPDSAYYLASIGAALASLVDDPATDTFDLTKFNITTNMAFYVDSYDNLEDAQATNQLALSSRTKPNMRLFTTTVGRVVFDFTCSEPKKRSCKRPKNGKGSKKNKRDLNL